MSERLHLRAEAAEDVPALSALVQDMTVVAGDVAFDARARRLVLIGNRFRHEASEPTRVRSALRIDFVDHLRRLEWPEEREAVLPLLAILEDGGQLELAFGGGTLLRADVEVVDITLEDISGPWGALATPRHGD